jgi:hypothetical protein
MVYKEKQITLEQYFKDCDNKRVIDHIARAACTSKEVCFYIHPMNVDGDTLDYIVVGDTLVSASFKDMDFGQAAALLKSGKRVARGCWNYQWLAMYKPNHDAILTEDNNIVDSGKVGCILLLKEAIYILENSDYIIPWTPTQEDILATDWKLVE